jgi:hypothetical protein
VDELSDRLRERIYAIVPERQARRYLDLVAHRVRLILRGSGGAVLFSPALEERIGDRTGLGMRAGRELIEYLNLYAEVLGYRADRDHGAEIRQGHERNPSAAVIDGFVQSFAAYYVAEFLRNQIFWTNPIRDRDGISGRATRGHIRVALKLERFRVTLARRAGAPITLGGWFWRHAHAIADELARYLSRFPRERVQMLILDAAMARYYESRHNDRYKVYLTMASECLCSAEPLLLKLGMHNRVRQRFALERGKVMAESARLAIEDRDRQAAQRYLAICEEDIATFRHLASVGNLLWKNLAESQTLKLEKLQAALDETLSEG